MTSVPQVGTLFEDRFQLIRLISESPIASVFFARDQTHQRDCVLKLFPIDDEGVFQSYIRRLEQLRHTLHKISPPGLVLPLDVGFASSFLYASFPFVAASQSLDKVLHRNPLRPADVFSVIVNIVELLDVMHQAGLIHGDIKPANILIQNDSYQSVYLIDFGMMQPIGDSTPLTTLIATYNYLHPHLRGGVSHARKLIRSQAMISNGTHLGRYLDYYALGVTAFELLTGDPTLPSPLSVSTLKARLNVTSPDVNSLQPTLQTRIAALIYEMLTIPLEGDENDVYGLIIQLNALTADLAEETQSDTPGTVRRPAELRKDNISSGPVAEAIDRLGNVERALANGTTWMLVSASALQVSTTLNQESQLLSQVTSIFDNAQRRSKQSWTLTVISAGVAFLLVVGMIVTAVVLTVMTGQSQWGVMFGGASVTIVLGTLLWNPLDRIMRAILMTQMIEIVHAQIMAVFHTSSDLDRRMQAFQDGVAQLKTFSEKSSKNVK